MSSSTQRANFYIALFVCTYLVSYLVASLIAGLISLLLPKSELTDILFYFVQLLLCAAYMTGYSIRRGTHRKSFWSSGLLNSASEQLAIGHIGIVFIVVAIAVMVRAKSASGVVLAPALIWTVSFYKKGFDMMNSALQASNETQPTSPHSKNVT